MLSNFFCPVIQRSTTGSVLPLRIRTQKTKSMQIYGDPNSEHCFFHSFHLFYFWSPKTWIQMQIHHKALTLNGIQWIGTVRIWITALSANRISLLSSLFSHFWSLFSLFWSLFSSVADPDPPDPHVFGPPGSGSTSQRYGSGSGSCSGSGSGSFYHLSSCKKSKKNLDPNNLWLFLTFYLWKIM